MECDNLCNRREEKKKKTKQINYYLKKKLNSKYFISITNEF